MINYKIIIDKPAIKFIEKQPQQQRERILKAISRLPDIGDVKPMGGHTDLFRLRVGTYRILYTVENDVLTVRVLAAGNRGDVYK
ncbi:MAG: type II toxin-antitoxin system RelE/ParE family toxin [Hydrogenoanaerobacterium sp.]